MSGLTERQVECLSIIQRATAGGGKAPTFDEIKKEMGIASKSNIHRLISGLEDRGYVRRLPGRSRAISLLDPSQRSAFFHELNPDVKAVVTQLAQSEGTTPEVVMREALREWAESKAFVETRLT